MVNDGEFPNVMWLTDAQGVERLTSEPVESFQELWLDTCEAQNAFQVRDSIASDLGTSNLDAWAEDLEDLQVGPHRRVRLVWVGADVARSVAPTEFIAIVQTASAISVQLATRSAWGTPAENFPDDHLIEVQFQIVLVPARFRDLLGPDDA